MAEFRGAKQQERPRASVRPVRERVVYKQLVSVRHGATANELIEEQQKDGGSLQQRAAVRFVSEDMVSRAPISTGPRFAHDFSRVPTQTRPVSVVQAQFIAGEKNDQYGQEISLAPGGSTIRPPIADRLGANPAAPLIQRRPSAPPGLRYKLEVDLSSAKLTVRQGSTVVREVNILSGGATWTLIRAGRNVTTGRWKYKAKAFRIKRFHDEFVIRPKSHPDYTACTWFPWGKELDSFPTAPGRPPSTVKPPKGAKEYPVRVKATGEKQIKRNNGRWETIEQYCNPFGAHWAVIKGDFMLHGTDGNPGDTSGTPRERRTFTHGCIRTDNNTVKWLKGIINSQGGARLLIKP